MKFRRIFLMIPLLLLTFLVTGCDFEASETGDETKKIDISKCVFESASFDYDGEAKAIYVENLPEGCFVNYLNNNRKDCGTYTVEARIGNAAGAKETMTATLTINKGTGVLEADAVQTYVLDGKAVSAEYTINNSEQKVVGDVTNSFTEYGTYVIKLHAEDSTNYNESNEVEVTVNVVSNLFGLVFESKDFVVDGEEKALAVEGTVPTGMHVEYENNNQTAQGVYQVTAKLVKDEDNSVQGSMRALMTLDYVKNEEFEKYMDELLVMIFEDDEMSINFFFENAANYGIGKYEASFSIASLEWDEASVTETLELVEELKAFESKNLTFEEKDCLEILVKYFANNAKMTENMNYMSNSYLGSYLGAQANYPLELVEYKFRNVRDINNYLDLLRSSEKAFKSYFDFASLQAEKGYGMTDYVIDEVVSQCNDFVENTKVHYLVSTFNLKLEDVTFLTVEEKDAFKVENEKLVTENLFNAYKYIADNLPSLKGKATNDGGLKNYGDEGVEYYRLQLADTIGYYDINLDEVITYVDAKLNLANALASNAVSQAANKGDDVYNEFISIVTDEENKYLFSELEGADLVAYFEEATKALLPDLKEMPNISVKAVPTSLQDNFSPACYFVSPIDSTNKESIYINGKYANDKNYIFTTLAHEGYPGHLYQNVFTKSLDINDVRRVIRCSGYMEGWATYMELNSYNLIQGWDSPAEQCAIQYFVYNDIWNGLLTARLDLGIHYQGWTKTEAAAWVNRNAKTDYYNEETVAPLYNQVSEVATNSLMYQFSYLKLDDMRTKASNALGAFYDVVDFNTELLSYGAVPLEMLEEKIDNYIATQKFIYNIK